MLFRGLVKSVTYVFDIVGTCVRRINIHQNLRFLLEQHAEWHSLRLHSQRDAVTIMFKIWRAPAKAIALS